MKIRAMSAHLRPKSRATPVQRRPTRRTQPRSRSSLWSRRNPCRRSRRSPWGRHSGIAHVEGTHGIVAAQGGVAAAARWAMLGRLAAILVNMGVPCHSFDMQQCSICVAAGGDLDGMRGAVVVVVVVACRYRSAAVPRCRGLAGLAPHGFRAGPRPADVVLGYGRLGRRRRHAAEWRSLGRLRAVPEVGCAEMSGVCCTILPAELHFSVSNMFCWSVLRRLHNDRAAPPTPQGAPPTPWAARAAPPTKGWMAPPTP